MQFTNSCCLFQTDISDRIGKNADIKKMEGVRDKISDWRDQLKNHEKCRRRRMKQRLGIPTSLRRQFRQQSPTNSDDESDANDA